MEKPDPTLLQYCQKLVVFSSDLESVLIARRQGEADFDGVYSLVGGKFEVTDNDLLAGMKREKDEELGSAAALDIAPDVSFNVFYRKQDGNAMVLAHIPALYREGEINLNPSEYNNMTWVSLDELASFEPKIDTIPTAVRWGRKILQIYPPESLVRI